MSLVSGRAVLICRSAFSCQKEIVLHTNTYFFFCNIVLNKILMYIQRLHFRHNYD